VKARTGDDRAASDAFERAQRIQAEIERAQLLASTGGPRCAPDEGAFSQITEASVPLTLNLPPNAVFPSGCSMVIEIAASLTDLMHKAQAQGASEANQARNRKPRPSSEAIRQEARRLRGDGKSWRQATEVIWNDHPEWFPDNPHPDSLRKHPAQRKELLSRLKERVRQLCKTTSPLED
jgi:hypothetical protein